jgi:succinate-semialdehyde dehydrogenase / glutarate-semialdehyde dehydrogenase
MSVATRSRVSGSGRFSELAARVTVAPGAERAELEIENPATGQVFGVVPRCTGEDVELAVRRAREAQASWADTAFAEREALLMRLHDLLLERQDEVLDVIQLESGKARRHAFEEILDVALVSRY